MREPSTQRRHRLRPLTPNIDAIAWAKYAKEPRKITVMGGPTPGRPGIFLDRDIFDYVLRARPKRRCRSFLKRDGNEEKAMQGIPGLAAMRDGQMWVDNQARADQEARRPAAPGAPPAADGAMLPVESGKLAYIFTTARLPFSASSAEGAEGRGFRVRSTALIVDELRAHRPHVQPGRVLFVDEILTLRRKRITRLRRDPAPRAQVRVDREHASRLRRLPLLKHMHRPAAGASTTAGIGSQRMLDVLKKDLTPR